LQFTSPTDTLGQFDFRMVRRLNTVQDSVHLPRDVSEPMVTVTSPEIHLEFALLMRGCRFSPEPSRTISLDFWNETDC